MIPCLFCFGLGYTAAHLGAILAAEGWGIAGTHRCRDGEPAPPSTKGMTSLCFGRGRQVSPSALETANYLLISIPPDELGDPVLDEHAASIAAIPDLRWVGYLSTTGVYGDRDGDWVDENAELRPTGPRNRRRVAAEKAWLDLGQRHGLPVQVFRLAGIYGPGRSAIDTVRAGPARRVVKPGQVCSRTHVADITSVLRASMARPNPGAVYNVCDDDPAPPQDVVAFACALLGVPPPPEEPFDRARATMTEMAQSFYADSKRVANQRIKTELGVRLLYPDYRAGLSAIVATESGQVR